MGNVTFPCLFVELSSAVIALDSVVILLRRFIAHLSSAISSTSSRRVVSIGCSHGSSELFRLCLPLRQFLAFNSVSVLSFLTLTSTLQGVFLRTSIIVASSTLLLHQNLLMLCRNNSMNLTIKLLPLLLEHFIANLHVLIVCIGIETSPTARAGRQIIGSSLESLRWETSSRIIFKGRNYLLRYIVFVIIAWWFVRLLIAPSWHLIILMFLWHLSGRGFSFLWLILIFFILVLRFLAASILIPWMIP